MTTNGRRTIIVAATPTPNGDLHMGHMAGPYLAGDIYARYLRANGQSVIYTTCTDDSQSYVVSTAHRRGMSREQLCSTSTAAIQRSLDAMGISMAGLPPIDDTYRDTVLEFVTALHTGGRLRLRTVRLPFAEKSGTYLFDGLVTGTCPVCLATSCGGACESCGHPNSFDELLDPKSTVDPTDPVTYREQSILVLPMEEYRERLTAYFAAQEGRWRPRAMRLIRDLLARPLPDVPVTFPGSWGIPAPFPETGGQILYPWIEAMPAAIYSTWWSAAHLGERTDATDEHWRVAHDAELVYFHGFDNVYHWGLMDLVFLMAHGDRYIRPSGNVCNEFYDLEGEKFSTSRNHVVWSTDLLATVPRDLVRFYLALTAPEYERTNFSRTALDNVTSRRLVEPWNGLARTMSSAITRMQTSAPLPVTAAGRRRSTGIIERFRLCYALPNCSQAGAAAAIVAELVRLRASAEVLDGARAGDPVQPGDLLLEIRTLLACAAPILIDVATEAAAAGVDLSLVDAHAHPESIAAFRLPRLPDADRAEPAVPPLRHTGVMS